MLQAIVPTVKTWLTLTARSPYHQVSSDFKSAWTGAKVPVLPDLGRCVTAVGRGPAETGDVTVAEKHEMVLSDRLAAGAEEWACPRCGRRLLLRWPPHYEKLVLEPGDMTAIHVGGQGGVRAGSLTAGPALAGVDREWLTGNGIDWDGPVA